MRAPPDRQDVDLILRLYELRREAEMRKARAFVMGFQPKSLEDMLGVLDWSHPENAHFRQATSYWEMVSDFAFRELLHPEMFAAHCGEAFFCHAKFEPWIEELRRRGYPRFQRNMGEAVAKHPVIKERLDFIREIVANRARAAAAAALK